ncbi:hypothetical protein ALQ36_102685 [Pseudomonas syringae pv. primulae]|uniref:Uncharacterized protein n=1 Tax=Pseudomonas syringae pv. primulae TaxID=251707 RepID=A0A3M3YLN3_9PSED|nr:hypothetical protein ALQ36_102685 [Pseudomonas syringae pv. primulae]RMU41107.1 hypothetical protein ALP30_04629 [Pseudomonas syringae pv. primulae]
MSVESDRLTSVLRRVCVSLESAHEFQHPFRLRSFEHDECNADAYEQRHANDADDGHAHDDGDHAVRDDGRRHDVHHEACCGYGHDYVQEQRRHDVDDDDLRHADDDAVRQHVDDVHVGRRYGNDEHDVWHEHADDDADGHAYADDEVHHDLHRRG